MSAASPNSTNIKLSRVLCLAFLQALIATTMSTNPSSTSHYQGSNINIVDSLSNIILGTVNLAYRSTRATLNNAGILVEQLKLNNTLIGCLSNDKNSSVQPLCAYKDPDAFRNVPQIIESRGFKAEEHDVVTQDGYILTIHRIINPLVNHSNRRKLKPIILQHGLMSSSVDWVINSVEVRPMNFPRPNAASTNESVRSSQLSSSFLHLASKQRKSIYPKRLTRVQSEARMAGLSTESVNTKESGESLDHPNSLGFYLSNEGYDVFLANSRGNTYGQRHVKLSPQMPSFWDFTYDEQIKYDLPATYQYIKRLTSYPGKVAYVGHSQGTAMMFGLLSDKPDYVDAFEPLIMLAPVAFVGNVMTPARWFAYSTPLLQHINMRFDTSLAAIKYLSPLVCGPEVVSRELCSNLIFLASGFDETQFNSSRLSAYLAHIPSGTSLKNLAHYGQQVLNNRFSHFDHGLKGNLLHYGQAHAPDYDLSKIRSKSIVLFTADADWLAAPKDVTKLKASLRVKPYKTFNMSEQSPRWNHVDFLYGKDSGRFVNTRVVEVLREFDD